MRRLPPLIGLRAFEAAARHLSFKLAADELVVTPTAISHQIKLLEQYCGQLLFRRQPRPLSLTPAGRLLYPKLHEGFNRFAEALNSLAVADVAHGLRVTSTSAFAARWLLPKLPLWRQAYPGIPLDIISTYDVLDLGGGVADVAIRYARTTPSDGVATELFRDTFHVVGSPTLVGATGRLLAPRELESYTRIETGWPPGDSEAPTWQRWEREAKIAHMDVPHLAETVSLRFEEEIHAIDAVVAGQGIAICSDLLVREELMNGKLQRVSDVTLPGFGFYLVHQSQNVKQKSIAAFCNWVHSMA